MKSHSAVFLLLLLGAYAASAQSLHSISVGVKGGIPLIDQTTEGNDESQPYILGVSVEFRLPASFAVEVDGLYQRVGDSYGFSEANGTTSLTGIERQRGNDWEVPFLGKYYFRRRAVGWQAFVDTGWALREVDIFSNESLSNGTSVGRNYWSQLGVGAVASAGLRFGARHTIVPEIRYTRWGSSTSWMNPNELAFLLGINY